MKEFILSMLWPLYRMLLRHMERSGMILYNFGKGDAPEAPDYTPLANASAEAAKIGADLGYTQLAQNQAQFDKNMAVAAPIIQAQTGIMNQTMAQGEDYYNYMKDTFRPIEQSLVDQAQNGTSRYDTNANVRASVEAEASRAAADASRASTNAAEQNNRAMLSMGVNPNSGRFASLQVGNKLADAALRSSAQTQARTKGVALDYAKQLDAAALGRNLPGASTGAYNVAVNAGNSAVSNQNGTAAQYLNGLSAGNGTIMQGQGQQIQGLGNVLNSQTSAYNAALNNQGSDFMGSIGGILGGGATMYTALSDRRLKENIVEVAQDSRGFGIYEFNYIADPAHRFRGVMADEVEKVDPEAVVMAPNGYAMVGYGRLGLQMVEVQ